VSRVDFEDFEDFEDIEDIEALADQDGRRLGVGIGARIDFLR
jgi:hypothetical protein